jgi:phosphatidylserine decarboxylase
LKNIQYINRKTGQLITERPPSESLLKFLYHNPFGELALNLVVKRKLLSVLYGKIKSSPSSIKSIQPFVTELDIDMSEARKPMGQFTSFNDFFYRKLKPEARPIGNGLVSPADAKLLAFEFTLSSYLQDEKLAKKFENSAMLIFRLAPNDYHRYHFPYDGKVLESTKIKGRLFSVSPYALQPNFTRVFCENKREHVTLLTKDKGDILLSPVGATMVGTILSTFQPNSNIEKGDEMGYFAFGGSTVVMLVDKQQFKIDTDILDNTKNKRETAVVMGEKIGS